MKNIICNDLTIWSSNIFLSFLHMLKDYDILSLKFYIHLQASRLNLPNKIKDLQSVHVIKLKQIDHITCVRYNNHRTFFSLKFITKDNHFLGIFLIIFLSLNSKIVGTNMTMNFYG
jgi:hypothetical protein